jgi:Bacterial dnaA protein helix-turn-helix
MAAPSFAPTPPSELRIPLAQIDAVVSARLGPTRGLGNAQPACFNRQVAMYLAARIGRWSTTAIGRFYNGRDHSTVCYGIQRIESLKDSDPEVDALLSDLKQQLAADEEENHPDSITPAAALVFTRRSLLSQSDIECIADRVAARVITLLRGNLG